MTPFFNKQTERVAYVWLRLSLIVGWGAVRVLVLLAPWLRRRNPSKDFLFFPYAHKDNIGTRSRFQDYFPLLERDGFTYDVHYPSTREEYMALYHSAAPSRSREYLFYARLFWQRLRWIVKASDYRAVFFQRSLFPEYYDQRRAILEQLARTYSRNLTVDFYDADYARNETLYRNVVACCDKVTVVNQALYAYFSQHHPRVLFNDLSVDASYYEPKTDFAVHRPVRIFWTGSVTNARYNLVAAMPALEQLNAQRPLTLVMVSLDRAGFQQPFIEHHLWDTATFNNLLTGADLAIYAAANDDVFNRGKVAYKSLEYAAAKVPMVASPMGLSPHFRENEDVLLARNVDEWKLSLQQMMDDEGLRERLAGSAHRRFMECHDVHATYRNFLSFLKA